MRTLESVAVVTLVRRASKYIELARCSEASRETQKVRSFTGGGFAP